jgi:hypothetical protein
MSEGIILLLVHFGKIHLVKKIEIGGLFTIAGFVVVIFQLWQGTIVQRARFLTDYLTKIYTDEELNSAFHALVETYNDSLFDRIDEIAKAKGAKQISERTNAPVFDIFDQFQGTRKEGIRYYHPECFQGSEEERRLDALFGFLDVVGYHHCYGLIRMPDIAALLNYQLATLATRKVVARYLRVSGNDWWPGTPMSQRSGSTQLPYFYFRNMLGEFMDYNEKHGPKIRKTLSQKDGRYL